jgi:hypothetical protein
MSGLLGSGSTPTNAPILYSGLNVGTSQWNMPLPIFWGTRRLVTNAMAYADFQQHPVSGKGGGKGGGGKSQQYTYTADVLLGLSEGTIDTIQNIWSNGSTTTTTTLEALGMSFFNGALGQANWAYWESNYPDLTQGYSQTAYLGAVKLALGESASIPDNGFECIRASLFSWTRSSTVAGWINPNSHSQDNAIDCLMSDVITDFLTNVQYGGGFMSAGDLGPMTQYAAYLRAQGIFVSPLLNSQEKVTDILNRWAQITNSWIFWSGVQLEFLPLADAPITGNSVTFTPENDVAYTLTLDDLIADKGQPPVKVTRKDPADCYNRATVNICDRTLGYIDNPIPFPIDQMIDDYGLRDQSSVSADEICDPAVGAIVAQLIAKRAAYVRNTYQFKTSWRFLLCLPGTVLDIPLNFTGQMVRVRVTDIAEDDKGILTFGAEEFPGTAGTYIPPQVANTITTSTAPNLNAAPSSVNTPAILEPPANFTGGAAKLMIAASGETNWGGCTVYLSFDTGTSYVQIGKITAPAPQGTLTAALAAFSGTNPDTADTLAVDCTESGTVPQQVTNADATALRTLSLVVPQPTVTGGVAVVPTDGELLAFGAVTATGTYAAALTYLMRGQYGTAARAHAIGEQFTVIDVLGTSGTAVAYDLPSQYIGQSLYIKLSSFNEFDNSDQALSDCVAYQYVPTGAGYGTGTGGAPSVPTGLAAVAGAASAAQTWNANAVADNVTVYRLLRAPGAGASFSAASLIYQGYSLTYTDTDLAGSTSYTYFLEATNAVGTSSPTAGVTVTTLASGSLSADNFIFNETPAGAVNGTNTVFTLAQTPLAGALTLSVNGTVQNPSAYALSGNTITFATAPASGATILATYLT